MEDGTYYKPAESLKRSLLLMSLLFLFVSVSDCQGQFLCPSACQCSDLSADCRGDNNTLARVVQELPAVIESFKFTAFAPSLYTKVYIDLNTIQGLGKFQNLRIFQIQPYSQSAPYGFNDLLHENVFCEWKYLEEIHLNMHAPYNNDSMKAFNCLQHLKVLDLSYSRSISNQAFQSLLSTNLSRSISTLLLRNIQTLERDETTAIYFFKLFSNLNRSSLEVIDLSANAIRTIYPGLLLLPNLKKLDLTENLILSRSSGSKWTKVTLIEGLLHPSLEEISFGDPGMFIPGSSKEISTTESTTTAHLFNGLRRLLGDCFNSSKPSLPHVSGEMCTALRKVAGSFQKSSECVFDIHIPVGRHLKVLNASGLTRYSYPYINYSPRGHYCINPENALSKIDISNMHAAEFIDNPTLSNMTITGAHKLKSLNFINNDFPLENFQLFDTMPSLEQLLLGGNKVAIHTDHKNQLFKSLGKLRHLDLSRNELRTLPYTEFTHLSSLERLDLSDNKLSGFNIQLPDSPSLLLLNLSSNGMTTLRASMAHQFDRYPRLEVDLQGNAFVCNCEVLWFVGWVQTTPINLTRKGALECYTEEGPRAVANINLQELSQHCHPMSILEIALISASGAFSFMLLIIVLVVVYRQRWRIRHYWHRRKLRRERAALNDDYEYDAYVSYSDCSREVRRWVSGLLHEEMECKRGLRLFIHQRDLLGGGLFLERVDEAMRKCRKTILVLSPEFLQSRTCLYEAWSAHTSMVTEDRDAVVLVKLQPLPAGITGILASLLQMSECLEWTEDPIGQNLFWEQLEDMILTVLDNPIIN